MTIFTKVKKLLDDEQINDILITGGGIIPDADIKQLEKIGIGKLFGPGTSINDSLEYIQKWVKNNK